MCGIVGYVGAREAFPIIIKGLQRLEYRGYDSAGVALYQNNDTTVYKCKGKVSDLLAFTGEQSTKSTLGIGHTRWATHGVPDDTNAHPHRSNSGRLTIIHNGIIENYAPLKESLTRKGYSFVSQTDTEVLVNFIEEIQLQTNTELAEAVRLALNEVVGAYAIVVIDSENPNQLVAARKGSPLVLGIGEKEYFLASDASPIIEYTKNVVYMNDGEVALLDRNGTMQIKHISSSEELTPYIQAIELEIEALEKGGYEHYMLKEIHEQGKTLTDAMRGRIDPVAGWVKMGGLNEYRNRILNSDRFIIIACGTSWHSALIAEYLIEDLVRMPVEVEYASEFRYRNPIVGPKDVVIAISQSGETADTLAALELAKERGALTIGICNVVGSSIARMTHAGSYIHAGPEIGVASTKAFTGQVTILTMIALDLARQKGTIAESYYRQLVAELGNIPQKVSRVLENDAKIKYIAQELKDSPNALYLGRGYNFPVALEGALKLKEISYIHAEGYPAAEMKHGPIALIDENMPVIVICTNKSAYEKIVSNVQEVKARKGRVIAVVTEGDTQIKEMADYTIEIPDTEEPLTPLLSVIPMQILSYYIATMRGCNVDQPRNLAKSVTVE
ncbi:MAG: glucosamine--fructose-6-phosphate aminotransferase [Bacteroidota bacterium]|jgi:glucosamine--fructose-6-phosphate aminotransferase (isomerizing)